MFLLRSGLKELNRVLQIVPSALQLLHSGMAVAVPQKPSRESELVLRGSVRRPLQRLADGVLVIIPLLPIEEGEPAARAQVAAFGRLFVQLLCRFLMRSLPLPPDG